MNYRAYLRSQRWRRIRARMLMMTGGACEWPMCGDDRDLEVHHRHYETLDRESSDDLVVLCEVHHAVATVRGRYSARDPVCDKIVEERTWHLKELP